MLNRKKSIEDAKNLAEEAARKVDFAKRFADNAEKMNEEHQSDAVYDALYSLKDCLKDAGDASIDAFSKLKSLQDAEKNQPEFVEENFMKAAEIICAHCKATENYWLTDCEPDDTGLTMCTLAKLKNEILEGRKK